MKLKNKNIRNKSLLINIFLSAAVCFLIFILNVPWNTLDYKAVDLLYKLNLEKNNGPKASRKIIILNIDDQTYDYFGSNYLNRKDLSKINNALYILNTNAVFYDIIFPRSSTNSDDSIFASSIEKLGNVYLPVGLKLSTEKKPFAWEKGFFYDVLKNNSYYKINTIGKGEPFYAEWAIVQKNVFAKSAFNRGHISIVRDEDGVIRHYPMIVKIDSLFFPTITLQLFLDYNKIPFNKIKVNWGNYIIIPALKNSFLNKEIKIPIDKRGMTFIPFQSFWENSKIKMMSAQKFLEYFKDDKYYSDLLNYYEGSFVFISDISVGTSDLGQTTIEDNVPLVTTHAALFNAMLTNKFYSEWKTLSVLMLLVFLAAILIISSLFKSNLWLYLTSVLIIIFLALFSYLQILNFKLFPFVTTAGAILIISIGIFLTLSTLISKEQAFIKSAFSKYVPANIVDELLENPSMLKLGGEERVLTILFSDLANFTSLSEKMDSTDLVPFLNEYLSEMTDIIIKKEGTIDKYIGDAILAEFGAPVFMENHASAAVTAALTMQKRISELNESWMKNNLPLLNCRVGVNTGKVIIGNMGSDRVFDYTVIGDSVNLAARLESANKFYNTSLMISEFTFKELKKDEFKIRMLDVIKVKGKSKAVKVYEVYGFFSDEFSEKDISYYQTYEDAFKSYLNRDFENAKILFEKALTFRNHDKAAAEMLRRIENLKKISLDDNWDGSIALLEK